MKILTYKRTHNGDPDERGIFGVEDCMGTVRKLKFDAVIGIGGIGTDAQANGIAEKINWIGIGPRKHDGGPRRGPVVTFDHYLYYGPNGPELRGVAPRLAERMYVGKVRFVLHDYEDDERQEALKLVESARHAAASPLRAHSPHSDSKNEPCVTDSAIQPCGRFKLEPLTPATSIAGSPPPVKKCKKVRDVRIC